MSSSIAVFHPTQAAHSQSASHRFGFLYSAETTFNLPLSSNVLFLTFTNISGPTMSGSVDIVTAPNQPHDTATVQVVTHYIREDIYNESKVSMVCRAEGEYGVDVSVANWVCQQHHHDDGLKLFFETTVTFPEPSSPVIIKKFETDVHNIIQKVGDLKDKVLFQTFCLKGTNGDIYVKSLEADQGGIKTSNGNIHGHFDIFGELILSTSNGRIQTKVGLTSIGGSKAKLSMSSANGNIESKISLYSSSGSGGSFEASATTTNGLVNINFPTAPIDSKLTFVGKTENGKATISLNPAYEGAFNLQSALSIPQVDDYESQDPSGKNRRHRVLARTEHHSRPSRNVVTGQVYWEEAVEEPKARGIVDIRTKNGKLVLSL